jgi:hypothetical protein
MLSFGSSWSLAGVAVGMLIAVPGFAQTAGDASGVCQPGQVLQANGQSCLAPSAVANGPPGPAANCQPGQVLQPNGQSCLPAVPAPQLPAANVGSASPAEPTVPNFAIATTTLNVRAGPGPTNRVIGVLQGGSEVAISGCAGGWCAIGHQQGWVAEQFLSFSAAPAGR